VSFTTYISLNQDVTVKYFFEEISKKHKLLEKQKKGKNLCVKWVIIETPQ